MDRIPDYRLDPPDVSYIDPKCPVCGSTYFNSIYRNQDGEICGCSECITILDTNDYLAEIEDEMRDENDKYRY